MKKQLIIFLFTFIYTCQAKPLYENTWLELTETNTNYVIRNYPLLYDESLKNPNTIIITKDSLIDVSFSDGSVRFKLENIENLGNESYFFKVGNYYKFEWFDKEKHIARWIIYYGEGDDRIMRNTLYIDNLHNTYPVVDCIWKDEGCVVEQARRN